MTPDDLFARLSRAWDRAVAVSGAEDLPEEFVNVILPLMPEVAGDILRALREDQYGEEALLLDHAPLLARYARDLFLERVVTVSVAGSPVPVIAEAALAVPPEERAPFRAAALDVLARTSAPEERVGALLAWKRVEPDDVAARLTAEALALLPEVTPRALSHLASAHFEDATPGERAALLARIASVEGEDAQGLWLTRCALAPPEERVALARAAVEHAARAAVPEEFFYVALAARDLVGFAPLRPWFERRLREVDSARGLWGVLDALGPDLPPDLLDRAEARLRGMHPPPWHLATTMALIARHHASRREALRAELRELVEHVVGDPVGGTRMAPGEYRRHGVDLDALRAAVAMEASAAFEGDERRELQQRALAIVERAKTGALRHGSVEHLPWVDFGAALDPALRAEAVRVALTIRHRPAALKAVGELVAAFPEASRHLALLGLARLADGAAPKRLGRALAALDRAARARVLPPARGRRGDRAEVAWTSADAASLGAFMAFIDSAKWIDEGEGGRVFGALTPAAARHAAAYVLTLEEGYLRRDAARVLAGVAALAGAAERATLVADLLRPQRWHTPPRHEVEALARCLLAVCDRADAAWTERVGAFFEHHSWNIESILDAVVALAPVLRRLGGDGLVQRLAARLRDPIPVSEVARPWALTAAGTFDA